MLVPEMQMKNGSCMWFDDLNMFKSYQLMMVELLPLGFFDPRLLSHTRGDIF